ncbi:MAG: hypothetical protein KDA61_22405, partial [Planctomycetales bacterium]|nr:hypothetical protein [Planctomycetales bacterium]
PVLLVFNAANPTGPRVIRDSLYLHTAFGPEIAEQDLILVNPPSQMHAAYVSLTRAYDGLPIPRGVRMLAPGLSPIEIERTDERTLVIAAEGGYMNWVLDRLFRNEVYPISAGYQVELDGFTVTVLEVTGDGRPLVASFEFAEPLESESYRWLYWKEGRFLPWTPIAVGQKVRMAPPELGRMLRGNYKPTLSDAE